MNNINITPEQALNNLLISSRENKLTYDEHILLDQCAMLIADILNKYKQIIEAPIKT